MLSKWASRSQPNGADREEDTNMNAIASESTSGRRGDSETAFAQVSDETFTFRQVPFDDRKVTGAQIVEGIGAHPVADYVVLHQLRTYELETLRPTELVDLSKPARFFVIKGDGTEKFTVDGLSLEWPRKVASGLTIKRLVGKDDDEIELILEREDAPDKVVEDDDDVRLGTAGVEKFKTRPAKVKIKIIVNGRPKEWTKKKISFAELVAIAYPVPPTGQCIVYTITYHQGPPSRPEGTLTEGESVRVRDEMVFNVRFTDKS
jgi:hypothetical protein